MPEAVVSWLLSSGPLGVATLILALAVRRMYRDANKHRHNEREALLALAGAKRKSSRSCEDSWPPSTPS